MGNPKPEKNGFHKFISSILSDVEKFAESEDEIFFKSDEKWQNYLQKNWIH